MGFSGVVSALGLRIAGISGIFSPHHYRCGYFEQHPFDHAAARSIYHYREFEFAKLKMVCLRFTFRWSSQLTYS